MDAVVVAVDIVNFTFICDVSVQVKSWCALRQEFSSLQAVNDVNSVICLVNGFLDVVLACVDDAGGHVQKLIGDWCAAACDVPVRILMSKLRSVIAYFKPAQAWKAVSTAVAIQRELSKVRADAEPGSILRVLYSGVGKLASRSCRSCTHTCALCRLGPWSCVSGKRWRYAIGLRSGWYLISIASVYDGLLLVVGQCCECLPAYGKSNTQV